MRTAMEGLAEAKQHQEHMQDELKSSRVSLDMNLVDMKESMLKVEDSGEVHDVVCRDL